jgi:8-oxo-dGTP pyrophosphatase MutT (NUDIX family)
MTEAPAFPSTIDAEFQVPGDERIALARAAALEAFAGRDPSFDGAAWQAIVRHDAAAGFGTRFAARAVLRRRSDGRFVIFRYPFRDGTTRFVLPGGGAEPGETPSEAVRREVFEETGTHALELAPTGVLLYHLLASTIYGAQRQPRIQYSPVFVGTIADELPHTDGREAHWFSAEEFAAEPRRPIIAPVLAILRAAERDEPLEPHAVWLPA